MLSFQPYGTNKDRADVFMKIIIIAIWVCVEWKAINLKIDNRLPEWEKMKIKTGFKIGKDSGFYRDESLLK